MQEFLTSIHTLLDPGSTFSFVSPLLSLTFDVFPDDLCDPIMVSTPLVDNVRTDRVYEDCPIVVCGNTMCA